MKSNWFQRYLLPGFVFASGGRILALHLEVLKIPKYEVAYTWLRFVVMCLGILVGYPLFGLWAMVVAITLSRIVRMVFLTRAFLRVTSTPLGSLIPTQSDVVQAVRTIGSMLHRERNSSLC